MIEKVMKYPGDRPEKVQVFNQEEFLEAHPRKPVTVTTPFESIQFEMGEDEILCDLCGDDPGNLIHVLHNKAYCVSCYEPLAKYTE